MANPALRRAAAAPYLVAVRGRHAEKVELAPVEADAVAGEDEGEGVVVARTPIHRVHHAVEVAIVAEVTNAIVVGVRYHGPRRGKQIGT